MRIISGKYKGRRIEAPKGLDTRPTSDRVREAVFGILTSRLDFDGLNILDLCSGSGALGLESISRGASWCCFVEKSRVSCRIIDSNIRAIGCQSISELRVHDVLAAIGHLEKLAGTFDIVFFDPPYSSGLYIPVLEKLALSRILTEDSLVVAESRSGSVIPEAFGSLVRCDQRIYGDTSVSFYKKS